jgi:hypothetical protein
VYIHLSAGFSTGKLRCDKASYPSLGAGAPDTTLLEPRYAPLTRVDGPAGLLPEGGWCR